MAWHRRHVKNVHSSSSLRTTVVFYRQDLLWEPDGGPFGNPYTGELTKIPIENPKSKRRGLIGPNVLDAVTTEYRKIDNKKIKYFIVRQVSNVFEDPEKIKKESEDNEEGKDDFLRPFKKSLSTAGDIVHRLPDKPFIKCLKKTSVSVSKLSYLLAVGVFGGTTHKASSTIGMIAAEAWRLDIERALKLFEYVSSFESGVAAADLPSELLPGATISQTVETAILREVCEALGTNPDQILKRAQGRPKGSGKKSADQDENSQSGEVVRMSFENDGTLKAELLKEFSGFVQGTTLDQLTLKQLATLLIELEDAGHEFDAQMVEAFLDAQDPEWRDTLLDEETESSGKGLKHDPYSILGVDKNMTFKEITKAYRKLMSAIHPDRLENATYFAQMANEAYEQIKRDFQDE